MLAAAVEMVRKCAVQVKHRNNDADRVDCRLEWRGRDIAPRHTEIDEFVRSFAAPRDRSSDDRLIGHWTNHGAGCEEELVEHRLANLTRTESARRQIVVVRSPTRPNNTRHRTRNDAPEQRQPSQNRPESQIRHATDVRLRPTPARQLPNRVARRNAPDLASIRASPQVLPRADRCSCKPSDSHPRARWQQRTKSIRLRRYHQASVDDRGRQRWQS